MDRVYCLSGTGCRNLVLGLSLGISNSCMTMNGDVIRSNIIDSRANESASIDTVHSDIDLPELFDCLAL